VFAITYPAAVRSLASVIFSWGAWKKVVRWTLPQFAYAFCHTLPPSEQKAAYDRYVIPETGRVFIQAALNSKAMHVNFANASRPPLLIIAGQDDHIVPAGVVHTTYRKYQKAGVATDFKAFSGRTHWLIAQPGWEEIASYIQSWVEQH
jgi:alpha-beta hydrolase superfamily lysophospholipase